VTMNADEYSERQIDLNGWPVNISSYRVGSVWHSKADNASPGASMSRATGRTREEAEEKVVRRATQMLSRTKRREF